MCLPFPATAILFLTLPDRPYWLILNMPQANIRRAFYLLVLLLLGAAGTALANNTSPDADSLREQILQNPWQADKDMAVANDGYDLDPALFLAYRAHALQFLDRQEDFDALVQEGINSLQPSSPPQAHCLLRLFEGVSLRRAGDYEQALARLREATALATEFQLVDEQVFALAELSFTRSLQGDNEGALNDLQIGHTLALEQNDPFLIAQMEEGYGVVYGYVDDYPAAIRHYERSLAIYRELGYLAYQAEALYGIGVTYRYWKKWDQALATFEEYRVLTEQPDSQQDRFSPYYGLGTTYAQMGRCRQALPHIQQAMELSGPLDFKAELLKARARCLIQLKDVPAALEALDSAQALFDAIPSLIGTRWELEVHEIRAEALATQGNHAAALQTFKDYHTAMHNLQASNASANMEQLRLALEDRQKSAEIALLREQTRRMELENHQANRSLARQRELLILGVIAGVVILLLLVLLARSTLRFRRLSTQDDLTGLHNRRHLFRLLGQQLAELPPDRGQLAAALIDIDDFKKINDQHGHPAGDAVIRAVASTFSRQLRHGEVLARVGGEEFFLVLPRTSAEDARAITERLLAQLRERDFPVGPGRTTRLTASAGVAEFGPGCATAEQLYEAADRALYASKAAGKNCATLYDTDTIDEAPAAPSTP